MRISCEERVWTNRRKTNSKLRRFQFANELYRLSYRRDRRNNVNILGRGYCVVCAMDPYGRYPSFSRTEPLLFLSSSSSVIFTKLSEPIRKSGNTGNRSQNLWNRSQEPRVFRLLVTANFVPNTTIIVTLVMEAQSYSETSVLTIATRHNISEDAILLNPYDW
jgi:hypothetical protein